MIVNFKVSVNLDGGAKHFSQGEHVLTKEESENDYIQALINDGLVEVVKADVVALEAEVVEKPIEAIEAPKRTRNKKED